MPGNTLFDPKEVEDFIENGGVSHNTKLARRVRKIVQLYGSFVQSYKIRQKRQGL